MAIELFMALQKHSMKGYFAPLTTCTVSSTWLCDILTSMAIAWIFMADIPKSSSAGWNAWKLDNHRSFSETVGRPWISYTSAMLLAQIFWGPRQRLATRYSISQAALRPVLR